MRSSSVHGQRSEPELVALAVERDSQAFEELWIRNAQVLHRLASRLSATPDELLQTAAEKAWAGIHSFAGSSTFSSWMYTIVTRSAYRLYDGRAKTPIPVADINGPETSHAAEADEVAAALLYRQALLQLPIDHRLPVVLADLEDKSYQDIADLTGWPLGTVKTRVHRGRRALAAWLRGQLNEERPSDA